VVTIVTLPLLTQSQPEFRHGATSTPPLDPPPGGGAAATSRRLAMVMAATWVVSALLASIAPFLSFVVGGPVNAPWFHVNGWGKVTATSDDYVSSGGHAIRYGIVLAVVTCALLVGAVGQLWRSDSAWPRRFGLVGASGLVTIAATVGLDAFSYLSYNHRGAENRLGIGTWLVLAAGVVAVLGMALAMLPAHRSTPIVSLSDRGTGRPHAEKVTVDEVRPELSGPSLDHLSRLGDLHRTGVLTNEEFATLKAQAFVGRSDGQPFS
jgi:hypothetical protein